MAITPQKVKEQELLDIEAAQKKLTPAELKEKADRSTRAEKALLEEERIFRGGVVSIKDLLAPAALEVTPTFIKLGQKFVRTLFVISYPRYIAVGWFAPIINLSVALDI